MAVAQAAADAVDHTQRVACIDQHRPLLDVQFDEAIDRPGFQVWRTAADALGLAAELRNVRGQRFPGVEAPRGQGLRLQQAEGGFAADVGHGEPGAFFGAHGHHGHVAAWNDACCHPACQYRQAGHHAGRAVVVAAAWHRVEV
jgi:hypothetical protein